MVLPDLSSNTLYITRHSHFKHVIIRTYRRNRRVVEETRWKVDGLDRLWYCFPMNPRNLVETALRLASKIKLATPMVEARFVEENKVVATTRGETPEVLRKNLSVAYRYVREPEEKPVDKDVLYASGYFNFFSDNGSPLMVRQELGENPDRGLEMAWAFLGEVQESGRV